MRRRGLMLALLGLAAAACVENSFVQGLPCASSGEECPPGQSCYTVGGDSLCLAEAPTSCNPIMQNCPGDEACYANNDGSGTCLTAGSTTMGECQTSTDCAAGAGCFQAGTLRVCIPYCDVNMANSCPMATDECVLIGGNVGRCLPEGSSACDPNNDTCTSGQACYLDEQSEMTSCESNGNNMPQTACSSFDECIPGHHCVECLGVCRKYCDTTKGNEDCAMLPDMPDCQPLVGTVGYCGVPCN